MKKDGKDSHKCRGLGDSFTPYWTPADIHYRHLSGCTPNGQSSIKAAHRKGKTFIKSNAGHIIYTLT
jgi:hypothetical protein